VIAAVVGIVLNLAVTFGIVALFADVSQGEFLDMRFPLPDVTSIDLFAVLCGGCRIHRSLEVPMERAVGGRRQRPGGTPLPNSDLNQYIQALRL
jgi:hypothetical protein